MRKFKIEKLMKFILLSKLSWQIAGLSGGHLCVCALFCRRYIAIYWFWMSSSLNYYLWLPQNVLICNYLIVKFIYKKYIKWVSSRSEFRFKKKNLKIRYKEWARNYYFFAKFVELVPRISTLNTMLVPYVRFRNWLALDFFCCSRTFFLFAKCFRTLLSNETYLFSTNASILPMITIRIKIIEQHTQNAFHELRFSWLRMATMT